MRQAGEPTVEEILDSIKKVIARDNRAATPGERTASRRQDAQSAAGVHDDGDWADRHEEDVLDLSDGEMLVDDADLASTAGEDAGGPLIGPESRASMRDSLAALAMLAQPGAAPQIVRSGETSLEGLVREMLRPMLAQWLDQNLPPMVEKLVAAEIARIVRKQG